MRLFRRLQPALAALLAACVLLLGLATVSPGLHEWVCAAESHAHHHSATDHQDDAASLAHDETHHHHAGSHAPDAAVDDHVCAVHLFAHGCTAAVPLFFVSPTVLNATSVAHFTEFMLARTLRGPARVCGPPALA